MICMDVLGAQVVTATHLTFRPALESGRKVSSGLCGWVAVLCVGMWQSFVWAGEAAVICMDVLGA